MQAEGCSQGALPALISGGASWAMQRRCLHGLQTKEFQILLICSVTGVLSQQTGSLEGGRGAAQGCVLKQWYSRSYNHLDLCFLSGKNENKI